VHRGCVTEGAEEVPLKLASYTTYLDDHCDKSEGLKSLGCSTFYDRVVPRVLHFGRYIDTASDR
jgi:hypothetical protein